MVSADLEVVRSCLLTKFLNLMLRRVELQQRVIYTFREPQGPQAGRLIFSEVGWHAFLGFFDDVKPFIVGIPGRHIHALQLLSYSGTLQRVF